MAIDLIVTLGAAFMFVALVAGYATSAALSAASPERRRLRQMAVGGPSGAFDPQLTLVDTIDPRLKRIPGVPKSPKEMGRLRRQLARAGYTSVTAMLVYAVASVATPLLFAAAAVSVVASARDWFSGC